MGRERKGTAVGGGSTGSVVVAEDQVMETGENVIHVENPSSD